ncbi:hypothetical protein ZWY2020_028496 [Hordeum vulgare]|nr:hypothetical protein ZWY2020_028496 [Hordeum vulgare]
MRSHEPYPTTLRLLPFHIAAATSLRTAPTAAPTLPSPAHAVELAGSLQQEGRPWRSHRARIWLFAVDAGAALLTSPADREEWHDCVPELADNFSDLEELQVVRVQGADRSDRAVKCIVGKFFPDTPNPFSSPVLSSPEVQRSGCRGCVVLARQGFESPRCHPF